MRTLSHARDVSVGPRGRAETRVWRALRWVRAPGVVVGMAACAVVLALASMAIGAFGIPVSHVIAIVAGEYLGVDTGVAVTQQEHAVITSVRLPRTVLAMLVGAALGVAGAALQGVFRNPLADAGVVGAASGASLGATLAIVSGTAVAGALSVPIAAFCGALLVTIAVYLMSRRKGRTEVVTLILTGLAFAAVAEACVGLVTSWATDAELRDLTFWRLGSVGGATWEVIRTAAPLVLLAIVLIPLHARALDVMSLGEREAVHLGVHTEWVRCRLIALSALSIGAAVASAGMIAFVGLLVPHLIRAMAGPANRVVLIGSAFGGAALLTGADIVARVATAPVEMPIGVVMGLLGGPFFLFLLHRTRRHQGGWA